eukprot:TRINITY_DN36947_c0_g1_i2.p1 TRINITY_DN36947_c0_g1~~TRINITY_DN36947_c0_g1_i2.p1  ORF type:complete len:589 (+),score=63.24 TRINITY_DN36947_c0_g1_i2:74-1840(+)
MGYSQREYWDEPRARWSDLDAFARPYRPFAHQHEALRQAVRENCIVILPTGTGKTLIAAMLIDLYSTPDSFILFIVNNVALVEQQARYLSSVCASPHSVIRTSHMGLHRGVTVGTAGAILALMSTLPLHKLSLVVFDEVHHAVGDHPYVQVLNILRAHCPVAPRILGLTASWLHGELRDLEAKRNNLERVVGARIILPAVSDALTNNARVTKVNYPDDPQEVRLANDMVEWITNATGQLHPELAQLYNAQAQKAVHVELSLGVAGLSAFPTAIVEVVESQLQAKATHALDEFARTSAQSALESATSARELMLRATEVFKGIGAWGPSSRSLPGLPCPPPVMGDPSPKARVLLDLLAERGGRTLVFVEQVCSALPLAVMLAAFLCEPVLHVSGALSMQRETREKHLSLFRNGTVRVLVATAALEEGLDIPDCDCVVRFDAFANVKSHVQGSGRARKEGSEVFYFDNSPAVEARRVASMHAAATSSDPQHRNVGGYPESAEVAGAPNAAAGGTSGDVHPLALRLTPGTGENHQWGQEETIWDHRLHANFRGQRCLACNATLRITSRKYGKGRKKTERTFNVEGPFVCRSA